MRIFFVWILCFSSITFVNAQVKIGDNLQDIDQASVLELESTDKALVITRVATLQMNAITPLSGAMVYNTEENCVFVYDGSQWKSLCEDETSKSNVTNGLTEVTPNTFEFGGSLNGPTTLIMSNTNTLAFDGLQELNDPLLMMVTIDPTTGILYKSVFSSQTEREETLTVASDGQNQFLTPATITNSKKIDVYRNGIKIDFTVIGTNLIELDSSVVCFQDDEIRIVQFY